MRLRRSCPADRRHRARVVGGRRLAAAANAAVTFTPCPHSTELHAARRCRCRSTARRCSRARSRSASRASWPARRPASDAVLALAGGPGQARCRSRRIHRPGDRARARLARPAGVRPARHGHLGPAQLPGASKISRAGPIGQLFEQCALDRSVRHAAPSRPRNRSRTSRRCAAPPATRSSSSTAPPTARRSRSSTPNATRSTSRRWCSTRSCPPTGPEPFAIPTFRRSRRCCASSARRTPAPASPPTRVGDLARLIARLRRHALSGSVYDGAGRRHTTHA